MSLAVTDSVTLNWVPGYTDIQGNESADKLTSESSTMDLFRTRSYQTEI
jgi:ribonuclease HI